MVKAAKKVKSKKVKGKSKPPRRLSGKKSRMTKKHKKPGAKGKSRRTLLSQADCQRLGYQYKDIAEADINSGIGPNLSNYLARHPKLRAAYDRGRLLKKLVELAPIATVTDAARQLKNIGFVQFKTGQDLRDFLDKDTEACELWDTADTNATIENRESLRKTADKGNTKAIQMMDTWFRDRKGEGTVSGQSFDRVNINQMAELFGISRQTLYEWRTQRGLPVNVDGSFDLHSAINWFEDFTLKKAVRGNSAVNPLNPFQAVKTEREKLKLEQDRGELIECERVIAWRCSILQNIVNAFNAITDLANRVFGQSREEIVARLEDFRDEVMAKVQHVPAELKLGPEAAKKLAELDELIKPGVKSD